VREVERVEDGTRVVHVVTDDQSAAACPACGVLLSSVRHRRRTRALLATARTGGQRHDVAHRLHRFNSWCHLGPTRAQAPRRDHRSVVARSARLPADRHHQRWHRGHEQDREDRRAPPTASAIWTTDAAEYGSPAPGTTVGPTAC